MEHAPEPAPQPMTPEEFEEWVNSPHGIREIFGPEDAPDEHDDDYVDHLADDEFEGVVAYFAFHPEEMPEGALPLDAFPADGGVRSALAHAAELGDGSFE